LSCPLLVRAATVSHTWAGGRADRPIPVCPPIRTGPGAAPWVGTHMQPLSVPRPGRSAPGLLARLFGPLFRCLPAALLATASLRAPEEGRMMLLLGTAFQLLVCVLSLVSRQGWRQAWGPSIITLYVIGLGWLWIGMKGTADWFTYLAQAILLMVPLLAF